MIVIHLNQARHGVHEWHDGGCHRTHWNSSDIKRFPRYMSLIQKNHFGHAKGIFGPIASGYISCLLYSSNFYIVTSYRWYRSINFRPPPPPAGESVSEDSEGGNISPETDDNLGL
jgi:hypothetical protein